MLLEREELLRVLTGLAESASRKEGRIVFVEGEAGVGKTALIRELRVRLPSETALFESACDPLTTPMPLGPVYDVAAQIGGRLQRLLTEEAARADVFQALIDAVRARPSVLVIEDVHWADDATHDLLRFLGRRIGTTQALVVATLRADEVHAKHPLRAVIGDLAAQTAVVRLTVPPLSIDAVRTLTVGVDIDAGELHRRTGGNAFFVTEVIAAGGGSQVPSTVRDAVVARAARLPARVRELLEAAAVVGARSDPEIVAKLASAEPKTIDECVESGLLRIEGASLTFRHELGRMAVADAISPVKKLGLHRAALALLRARQEREGDLAVLAHHAEQAGDAEAVLDFAPRAAHHASRLGAHREAADQYARALRFAERALPRVQAELLEGRSLECYITGNDDSHSARERALAIRRALDEREMVSENLRWLSRIAWVMKCGPGDAIRFGHEAVNVLEGLTPTCALAWAYSNLAQVSMLVSGTDDALT